VPQTFRARAFAATTPHAATLEPHKNRRKASIPLPCRSTCRSTVRPPTPIRDSAARPLSLWRPAYEAFYYPFYYPSWKNSTHKHRWLATALLDIEPRLRKVKGFKHLPKLREAIQRELKIEIEQSVEKVA